MSSESFENPHENPFVSLSKSELEKIKNQYRLPTLFSVDIAQGKINVDDSCYLGSDPHTLIPIASVSKFFTSLITLRLVDAQKITLHDTVQKHFPDLAGTKIGSKTVLHLLSHTASLTHDLLNIEYWTINTDLFPETATLLEALKSDLAYTLHNDGRVKYSNTGIALLGALLEKATNQSYREIAHEVLIKPLGLADASPDQTKLSADQQNRLLKGYGYKDSNGTRPLLYDKPVNTKAIAPSAGWVATIADMGKIIDALINNHEFLSEEMRFMLFNYFKPIDEGRYYGLGTQKWVLEVNNDWDVYGHFGWWFGVITIIKVDINGNGKITVCNTVDDYSKYYLIPKSNIEDQVEEILEIPSEISLIPEYFNKAEMQKFSGIWGNMYLVKHKGYWYLTQSQATPVDAAMKLVWTEDPLIFRVTTGHPLTYQDEPVFLKAEGKKVTEITISSEVYTRVE